MCPDYTNDLLTKQIQDDFWAKMGRQIKEFDPSRNSMSIPVETQETVTLEQINEKLDRLLMLNNVISSTLYTGQEVIEAFKKLHGVK